MFLELEMWDPATDFTTIVPEYNAELAWLADMWWGTDRAPTERNWRDRRYILCEILKRPHNPSARELRYLLACQKGLEWSNPTEIAPFKTFEDVRRRFEYIRAPGRRVLDGPLAPHNLPVHAAVVVPHPGACGVYAARLHPTSPASQAIGEIFNAWLEI